MVSVKMVAAALGLAATALAGFGFLPLHAVFVLAGQGWFAWADASGLDTIVLTCVALMLTGRRSWSAWALVSLSIPVQCAAIAAPAYSWLATVVAPWPLVAMLLGCATFLRQTQPFDTTEPNQ